MNIRVCSRLKLYVMVSWNLEYGFSRLKLYVLVFLKSWICVFSRLKLYVLVSWNLDYVCSRLKLYVLVSWCCGYLGFKDCILFLNLCFWWWINWMNRYSICYFYVRLKNNSNNMSDFMLLKLSWSAVKSSTRKLISNFQFLNPPLS